MRAKEKIVLFLFFVADFCFSQKITAVKIIVQQKQLYR